MLTSVVCLASRELLDLIVVEEIATSVDVTGSSEEMSVGKLEVEDEVEETIDLATNVLETSRIVVGKTG